MDKNAHIVFYCAWPSEGSAAGLADKYGKEGFSNTRALKDGPNGWKNAGYAVL